MNRPHNLLLLVLAIAAPLSASAEGPPQVAAPPGAPVAAAPVAAAPAVAATRPRPAIPAIPTLPTTEFDKLKFLVGAFTCDVDNARYPGGAALPARASGRFVGKLDLGGFFVTYQYSEARTKERPSPFASSGFVGWDPGLRRYVFAQADNLGLSFLLRADVPAVDQYVFKGTATAAWGRHLPATWTVTRTIKGFDVLAEGADIEGQVSRIATLTCLKSR